MTTVRVHKNDAYGQPVWHYDGRLIHRTPNMMQIEAFFARADVVTEYHTFRQGDRMVEWFFSQQWFNIFQMHDVDDGRLKGWYCNLTRPAHLTETTITADDLALDVMVYPNGAFVVLDEDDFAALALDATDRKAARRGLDTLLGMLRARHGPFWVLGP
ncbi:MAG: DUF402 domain-containing protein [Anaerolineales bacterium]